jgi:hypothetical protein
VHCSAVCSSTHCLIGYRPLEVANVGIRSGVPHDLPLQPVPQSILSWILEGKGGHGLAWYRHLRVRRMGVLKTGWLRFHHWHVRTSGPIWTASVDSLPSRLFPQAKWSGGWSSISSDYAAPQYRFQPEPTAVKVIFFCYFPYLTWVKLSKASDWSMQAMKANTLTCLCFSVNYVIVKMQSIEHHAAVMVFLFLLSYSSLWLKS